MAKKKSATDSAFHKCRDYRLDVINNIANGTDFDLKVIGDDQQEYNLQVNQFADRTALVQGVLHKLATLWPAFDFEFRADSANRIIEVR